MTLPEFITYCKVAGLVTKDYHGIAHGLRENYYALVIERGEVNIELVYILNPGATRSKFGP